MGASALAEAPPKATDGRQSRDKADDVAGKKKTTRTRATAETLAGKQREISVSEFFAKNRHLLGFDNPRKALLTTVKEAVDNALDACEESGVSPVVEVTLEHLPEIDEGRFRVTVQDNGPGVVRKQIDGIFGKLLYGSKFHRLKMSRGQQGIGISAAGMYGLMTTGKPMVIVTRPKKGKPAHHVELAMDTTKNKPEVTIDIETENFPDHTGTRVTIELEGRYMRGRTSIDEYLEQTAIANPHATFIYHPPAKKVGEADSEEGGLLGEDAPDIRSLEETTQIGDTIVFPANIDELPPEPVEIKPHPRGVELGTLIRMLKQTNEGSLGQFLQNEFCRVGPGKAKEICDGAKMTPRTRVSGISHAQAEALYKSVQQVKLLAPPLDCLAPIGVKQILAGLLKGVKAEFYAASTRPPAVYRGNPFQIEVGLAYGGSLPSEELARVIRFANRVPLLYLQSACASHKAVVETAWRNYGLSQSKGSVPNAPLVVMIHMASVWVPFTSESKEAIADYDEIRKEMRLALQECGRKLATYVRKRKRMRREHERRDIFHRYIGEVARALHTIDKGLDPRKVFDDLTVVAQKRTELADVVLDEEGKEVKGRSADDDGTIIVEDRITSGPPDDEEEAAPAAPARKSKKSKRPGAKPPKRRKSNETDGAETSDGDDSLFGK